MSAKKCKNCGQVVLPYDDKTTGAEKCPNCEPDIESSYIESSTNISRPVSEVIISDINMPFWSMVIFMVKWAFATIPAIIIITIVLSLCFSALAGLGLIAGLGTSK